MRHLPIGQLKEQQQHKMLGTPGSRLGNSLIIYILIYEMNIYKDELSDSSKVYFAKDSLF